MVTREALINYWHTNKTFDQVCRELDVSPSSLRSRWRELRKVGSLPMEARPIDNIDYASAADHEHDPPISVGHTDLLLERLHAVHGHSGRPDLFPGSRQ